MLKFVVGLDFCVDKVLERLNIYFNGVCFLGVYGIFGIGKIILVKVFFNKLVIYFENRCFILNVRERLVNEGGFLRI